MTGGAGDDHAAAVAAAFRREFGRSVAALVRSFGDVDVAEDAVQEAFAIALDAWARDGVPPNPGAWIMTTARRRAIDRLRREARGRELQSEAAALRDVDPEVTDEGAGAVPDDRLRLMFMCCHPALAQEAQVALTLRLLGGLSTQQVARAFLVAEATMAQRLVRAKRKVKAARIPFRVPEGRALADRLPRVLAVVYLIFNAATPGADEAGLAAEAIRLARLLDGLMPAEPETAGLLALLLLAESRRAARTSPDGAPVVLAEQDRSAWDRVLVDEGLAIVRRCLARDEPGPYQIQAAIQAVHADADVFGDTDWAQIVALYDQLAAIAPGPVVALNRAVAVAELRGPVAGLDRLDGLDLDGYYPFHAARADLLRRAGRDAEADAEYERAASAAPTPAERDFLRAGGRFAS